MKPWAANDRAPRDKRSMVERFADAVGRAAATLAAVAIASSLVAYLLGGRDAAFLFVGSGIGCCATMGLVSWFENKLRGNGHA